MRIASGLLVLLCYSGVALSFQPTWNRCTFPRACGASESAAVHAVATTTTSGQGAAAAPGDTFQSAPIKVYIEDTDAYGVIYNANYLKFYDRALQDAQGPEETVVGIRRQKFRASPSLGDEFVIEGVLKAIDEAERQVWDFSMKSLDGATVYHSAEQAVVVSSGWSANWLPPVAAFADTKKTKLVDSFTAYRDEFDPHLKSHLPLHGVLKHFERIRTNSLGGPTKLRELQEDHGLLFVLTGIKDLHLVDHSSPGTVLLNEKLRVEATFAVRRGGMRIDVYQTLFSSHGDRIAQGVISLTTINKDTFRPTSKLPPWLLERLMESGG